LVAFGNCLPWVQIETALAPAFARSEWYGKSMVEDGLFGTSVSIAGFGFSRALSIIDTAVMMKDLRSTLFESKIVDSTVQEKA
jgi:hypothetical protein